MASELTSDRQRKLGPAPIASFEDLSEDNGEQVQRLPGIVEAMTPVTPSSSLKTPSTPRIDISRASSSSQHDDSNNNSEESSPERELLAGGELAPGCKLTLGYKEDVQDLRSSTEELDLQDPIHEQDLNREIRRARKRKEDGTQSECGTNVKQLQEKERNNSVCSEIILLNISGRTSRLSSVGSQGSGISGKLSVVSNTSSRSPSPHKCMLETSFCGSKRALTENLIEPTKPETEDLEKILLQREADTTKALIPENIRIPVVDGNLKPDPLDKPRLRGREERKEIFKREVEITKKVLEKVNIQVPIIKKVQQPEITKSSGTEFQKPVTLDFNDKRKKVQDMKEDILLQASPTIATISSSGSPKLQRHQKIRDKDFEGSRTPSPSSVSRKNSFASLFKVRTDGGALSPESPSFSFKPRRSLTSKLKETAAETLKNVAKNRERVSIDKGTPLKKDSKNKGVFSSTLSLFRKRDRKKSEADETVVVALTDMTPIPKPPSRFEETVSSLESIGNVEFTFNSEKQAQKQSVFISMHPEEMALPSESVSIPLETPTKLLDEYDIATSGMKIQTEAKIEEVRPQKRNEKKSNALEPVKNGSICDPLTISQSSSKESFVSTSLSRKPPQVTKPKRKSREKQLSKQSDSSFEETTTRAPISNKEITYLEQQTLTKTPSLLSDLDHNSSESERDSEVDFSRNHKVDDDIKSEKGSEEFLDERKRLFYEESFEEDLPYVPTTLPLEKSSAIPILPVKERLQEVVKTIPIERPRSTTPINPTLLDEFVQHTTQEGRRAEKMKISLPREEGLRAKSPRRSGLPNTFSEFAGRVSAEAGAAPNKGVVASSSFAGSGVATPLPPLPPRGQTAKGPTRQPPPNWINFEDIPERRKTPKRIQTIPRQEEEQPKVGNFSFVLPEECRCECHEESRKASLRESSSCSRSSSSNSSTDKDTGGCVAGTSCNGENCTVASSTGERGGSVVSDSSSLDYSLNNEDQSAQALLSPSTRPFGMDLDVQLSHQSSVISQEENDDADL